VLSPYFRAHILLSSHAHLPFLSIHTCFLSYALTLFYACAPFLFLSLVFLSMHLAFHPIIITLMRLILLYIRGFPSLFRVDFSQQQQYSLLPPSCTRKELGWSATLNKTLVQIQSPEILSGTIAPSFLILLLLLLLLLCMFHTPRGNCIKWASMRSPICKRLSSLRHGY